MERLKFWKRKSSQATADEAPVIKRFNIQPRTDVGAASLPSDPDRAARLVALHKRRGALVHDLSAAEEAAAEQNRWRTEVTLIDQAIEETDRDLADLGRTTPNPGAALPPTEVTDVSIETEPAIQVRFRIGDEQFIFAEEIDWAERGHQLARSELLPQSGNVAALIPTGFPADQRTDLEQHLQRSLFVLASDLRDRSLDGTALPTATLADLARPSVEFGGWLDWAGQSATQQELEAARYRLLAERERLEKERILLVEDQAKTAENLPIARRRLADIEREIEAIISDT